MRQHRSGAQFEVEVARVLREAGVDFESKPRLGGVQPDFLVKAADGRRYVLEAKDWGSDRQDIERAVRQARLYQAATGADGAFVILPDIVEGNPRRGFLALHEVAHWAAGDWSISRASGIQKQRRVKTRKRMGGKAAPPQSRSRPTTVFAAMPFSREYDDVFFVSMAFAAESVGATCKRVDKEDFEGDIVEEIRRLIRESIAVIADLSEARPNVLYELGYAHALKKPTVPLCSTPLGELPFDVRNWNTIEYTKGGTHQLREQLKRRLKAAITRQSA